MAKLPDALPVAVGLNTTAIFVLCPGDKVTDAVMVVENPVPVTVTRDTVTSDPPTGVEFVSVRYMVLELPTTTPPKLKLDELSDTAAVFWPPVPLGVLAFVDRRLQPERNNAAVKAITAKAALCQWRGGFIFARINNNYLAWNYTVPESTNALYF